MVMFLAIAIAAAVLAAVAENRHAGRNRRIARLAFGPGAKPAAWTVAAPAVRVAGVGLATWGALVLLAHDPIDTEEPPNPRASRQLLICLDVSPSMHVEDAGPDAEKVSRSRWAGRLVQGILDRLDMKDTRISLIGFYTKALPILQDTTDKNVVANMFDGLRMNVAFESGTTDLDAGVRLALDTARPWARNSTTLVVISDGDISKPVAPLALPGSIASAIVIGVGDPNKATLVSGHSSRQDTWALKQLAAKLQGTYHEGNRLHLPSAVLDRLSMVTPRIGNVVGLREAGLIALGLGAAMIGLIGPALLFFGTPRAMAPGRVAHRSDLVPPQPIA